MKYFAIRPIKGISEDYAEAIKQQIEFYRKQGHEVYDPIEDTNQSDSSGLNICKDNRKAIEKSDRVLFIWDGKSKGCLFDLGMAFALYKQVEVVTGYVPQTTFNKSFQNMAFAWEEETNEPH